MSALRFGSVCSGIEAASVAFQPLGWGAAWFSEVDPWPSALLAKTYPDVVNLGDMTKLPALIRAGEIEVPDVLCGGTPCQAFSVAGLRGSLGDARGNLALTFCEIANAIDEQHLRYRLQPGVVLWENVPGIYSTKDNAFGCFLAGLAGEDEPLLPPGGKWTNAGCVSGPQRTVAWRTLDAQHFGVPQRRRRVFVVASAREGFDPTEVLFEFEGVRRDIAPSREPGQEVTGTLATGAGGGGFPGTDEALSGFVQPYAVANCLTARMYKGINTTMDEGQTPIVAQSIHENQRAEVALSDTASSLKGPGGKPGQGHAAVLAFSCKDHGGDVGDVSPTLRAMAHDKSHMNGGGQVAVLTGFSVRRLMPIECERLQGFPDSYTAHGADTPRYKALGNSWAVPVVRWIGGRIEREWWGSQQ